jgi:hypothetical protein
VIQVVCVSNCQGTARGQTACTFARIAGFIDPAWLVETEADCILQDTEATIEMIGGYPRFMRTRGASVVAAVLTFFVMQRECSK